MNAAAVSSFRELHRSGCFVLPNPWDVGSAVLLHHLGFRALASSSAGMAFTRGLPDTVTAVSREEMLAHIGELVRATPLPVNADFQAGYADQPDEVAANVTLCVGTGAAGLSIEDATGDPTRPLYEMPLAVERIRAARQAIDVEARSSASSGATIDRSGTGVVLTARCEAILLGHPDGARIALDRLVAFADAGADCLYAPGVRDPELIATLVKAVAPRPLNVLVSAAVPGLTVARLADLGVRRISLGSALARVAWGAFLRAAREMVGPGTFEGLAGAASFAELNDVFAAPR